MAKAYSYSRFSSKAQGDPGRDSLRRQLAAAYEYAETAASYGVTHEELAGEGDKRVWVDPRVWKLFHAAHQWNQHQTKQANSERAKQAQTTAPIKTVGTKGAPVDPLGDRASIDVWMKARRNSVRKGR